MDSHPNRQTVRRGQGTDLSEKVFRVRELSTRSLKETLRKHREISGEVPSRAQVLRVNDKDWRELRPERQETMPIV